ncbi:hypothetical protein KFK09_009635 [Dendrobium nobile]|uniref:Uncharacterized protein n=1 Tax=Dendrobium nobile TaxID=94219 RepID=A0A8T3BN98_DENNO|nr:hypothetical protein KFK09_009635 [Dendrobium nobile]
MWFLNLLKTKLFSTFWAPYGDVSYIFWAKMEQTFKALDSGYLPDQTKFTFSYQHAAYYFHWHILWMTMS